VGAKALLEDFASRIEHYQQTRDFPAVKGPSYLSVHLRFGTVSVRELARLAYPMHLQGMAGATTWLNELIWRDFYHQILANFPHVVERAFKPEYDAIHWEQRQARRSALCRLVRRPHRLPAGGRGHAPAQPDRLHAQPAAHGGGQLSNQRPGAGLAPGRAYFAAS
jgi:hypothetical protein